MPTIRYSRLPYQAQFDESTKLYDFLFAGYGAGKTYALVMKMLRLSAINLGLPGGMLVPDMQMFKRDVLPTIEQINQDSGLSMRFRPNPARIVIPEFGVTVYVFHSEDDGASIRGPNLAWGVINEITLCTEKAFLAFLARIRIKAAKLRQVAGSGTPEGFDWAYNRFVAEPKADTDVFFGDMRLNTFLPEDYSEMLLDAYDDVMSQLYVEGKFVNGQHGAALYKFNRQRHVADGINQIPGLDVWVSLDFNVAPFAATLYNRLPPDHESGMRLWGFDEIAIRGGDTWEMCRLIKEKANGARVVIFPDPAGNQRRTSAKDNITDIKIIEQSGFEDIRYKTKTTVRGALMAANKFLQRGWVVLDRKKCKETIKDFEQVRLKEGSNELDKSDPTRTHWVDGFKNMIDYEFPIENMRSQWKTVRIR